MFKFKRSKSIALEGILSKAWHGTTPIGFNGSHEANMPRNLFKMEGLAFKWSCLIVCLLTEHYT